MALRHSLVALAAGLALTACGSARQVQKTKTGGILELSGEWTSAFDSAHARMTDHCGEHKWAIVNEGRDITPDEGAKSNHAWRVYYTCYANNAPTPKLP
jgi:hypothetical protein